MLQVLNLHFLVALLLFAVQGPGHVLRGIDFDPAGGAEGKACCPDYELSQ